MPFDFISHCSLNCFYKQRKTRNKTGKSNPIKTENHFYSKKVIQQITEKALPSQTHQGSNPDAQDLLRPDACDACVTTIF